MRILVLIGLSLFASMANARGMSAVQSGTGFCAGREGICYERKLSSDPSIRLIAYGYEDGIEYSFHKRGSHGNYEHLIRIYPVLKDDAKPGSLFWGYPQDIRDIAVATNSKGQIVLATFDHSLIDDGEVSSPVWQKRIPAVLFIGHTTQPLMFVPALHFQAIKLKTLRSLARG